MKLPAFESLDEKRAWEAYKEANPPKGQAQFYYKDNAEYWKSGFNAGVIERDIQWHKKVEKLIQTLQEISKYKPVGMNVYDVAEGAVDSAKSALAEFYAESDAANAANGEGKND